MEIKTKPRSLIQINGKSLFVSLPIIWTTSKELKKGDLIQATITEEGNLLLSK